MWALITVWLIAPHFHIYVSYYTTQRGCELAMAAVNQLGEEQGGGLKSGGCLFSDRQTFEIT